MPTIDPQIAADARDALNDISSAAMSAQSAIAPYRFWMSASATAQFDALMARIVDAQTKLADIIKRAGVVLLVIAYAETANADELKFPPKSGDQLLSVTFIGKAHNPAIFFTMKYGACLRGPLQINDEEGKQKFTLAKGVYYPVGCDKGPK